MPISSEETSMEACRTDDNYSLTGAENLGKKWGRRFSFSKLLVNPL
jgi:hypothetical protein